MTCTATSLHHRGERQESHAAGLFDGGGQAALMARAVAGDPARDDLAAIRDEVSEDTRILVVDAQSLLGAEAADLSSTRSASPPSPVVSSTRAPAGTPASSSWSS